MARHINDHYYIRKTYWLFFFLVRYEQVIMDLLLPGSSDALFVKARLVQHLHESFSGGIFVNGP